MLPRCSQRLLHPLLLRLLLLVVVLVASRCRRCLSLTPPCFCCPPHSCPPRS
jgi:hypothetical protein